MARFIQLFGHLDTRELLNSDVTRPMATVFNKAALKQASVTG